VRSHLQMETLKNVLGERAAGRLIYRPDSSWPQGRAAKLVAETIGISRSSLYYQAKPRVLRANRSQDEVIIAACRDRPAYGYRRVAWWLRRKQGVPTVHLNPMF
jgi:hypothetical protein